MWMERRSYEPEIMDLETPPPRLLAECYAYMRGVNRWLGGMRATISCFERFARSWTPGGTIRILDVGAGGADIPRALVDWGERNGFGIEVTALDLDPAALVFARTLDRAGVLRYLCADVLRMPCRAGAFDYVTSSLFFHHLTDEQIVTILGAFDHIARRGIVVNDLVRKWRAHFWIKVFTLFSNSILRNDGPLSVRKALRVSEMEALVERSGLDYLEVRPHFGHRMTVSGEKRVSTKANRSRGLRVEKSLLS